MSRPSVEVVDVKVLDSKTGELELLVACKHIHDRGATLGGESPPPAQERDAPKPS